jgi:lipopolysaccharide/colanic/teichoic acid biosynthesis glycosyltransferase
MEIILAGLALFLLAPLPAFFAIAIKLDSRGPVIFRQPRIGRRGCRSTRAQGRDEPPWPAPA